MTNEFKYHRWHYGMLTSTMVTPHIHMWSACRCIMAESTCDKWLIHQVRTQESWESWVMRLMTHESWDSWHIDESCHHHDSVWHSHYSHSSGAATPHWVISAQRSNARITLNSTIKLDQLSVYWAPGGALTGGGRPPPGWTPSASYAIIMKFCNFTQWSEIH